jgi:hypothetical protein
MAVRVLEQVEHDVGEELPSVDEVMERFGFDRHAAELYLAAKNGAGFIGDRICVPTERREQVLREAQEAEDAYYAAVEEGAKLLDLSATVEENMTRTGLDRHAVEVLLALRHDENLAARGTE